MKIGYSERFHRTLAGLSLGGHMATLSPRAQVLLVALLVRVNYKAGAVAWPSLEDLKARTGYSKDTILLALDELEAAGMFVRVRQAGRRTRYVAGAILRRLEIATPWGSLPGVEDVPQGVEDAPQEIAEGVDMGRPEPQEDPVKPQEPPTNHAEAGQPARAGGSLEILEGGVSGDRLSQPLLDRLRAIQVRALRRVAAAGEARAWEVLAALDQAKNVRDKGAWFIRALQEGVKPKDPAADALKDAAAQVVAARADLVVLEREAQQNPVMVQRGHLARLAARCAPTLPRRMRKAPADLAPQLEAHGLTVADLEAYIKAQPAARLAQVQGGAG